MPTTTKYIWDDDNLLAEADGTNTINTIYTNEPEQYGNLVSSRIANTTSYHHFDATGSTRQLTNSAGTVTDRIIYDAWGNVLTRAGATPAFQLWIGQLGYYYDTETGMTFVRSRSFNTATARWLSLDIEFQDGFNRYLYVLNCPMGAVDPSGEKLCWTAQDPTPNCGNFSWRGDFGGVPLKKGFLVQKITATFGVKNCKDKYTWVSKKCNKDPGPNGSTTGEPETLEYWELWTVNARGLVYIPNVATEGTFPHPKPTVPLGLGQNHIYDNWQNNNAGDPSKGSYSVSAELYFVPNPGGQDAKLVPPGGWKFWTQNKDDKKALPGGAPFSCDPPKFDAKGEGVELATRSLKYKWVCCPCPATKEDDAPDVSGTTKC